MMGWFSTTEIDPEWQHQEEIEHELWDSVCEHGIDQDSGHLCWECFVNNGDADIYFEGDGDAKRADRPASGGAGDSTGEDEESRIRPDESSVPF
jgi:hypothetical protein